MSLLSKHDDPRKERHAPARRCILIVVAIGGMVEIGPLFYLENTIEKVDGVRPYSPLELAGRNIYIREGCYVCHSQMIRADPRRGRALRPLQPGGRKHVRPSVPMGLEADRAGPRPRRRPLFRRLARRALDRSARSWCRNRSCRPMRSSREAELDVGPTSATIMRTPPHRRRALHRRDDRRRPKRFLRPGQSRRRRRRRAARTLSGGAGRATSTASPTRVTEMDALIAYLQMLGTLVDFTTFEPDRKPLRGTPMETYSLLREIADSWGMLLAVRVLPRRGRLGLPARTAGDPTPRPRNMIFQARQTTRQGRCRWPT